MRKMGGGRRQRINVGEGGRVVVLVFGLHETFRGFSL